MTSPVSPSHPTSAIDPFSREFLSDPYPFHHQLREAGPAVWLERHSIWAVARYEEVFRTLSDWQTFCSSRGVGLADFGKEPPPSFRPPSPVLERGSARPSSDAGGAEQGAVADGHQGPA